MTKTLPILGFLAVFPAGIALADDDCFVPMADWQPRESVARLAERNGWTVRRIKIDDGCYEIDGRDAGGRPIEVTVHPATLEVIEFEYEDEDHRGRSDDDRRDRPSRLEDEHGDDPAHRR
ncbi:PepSY domain-containing protein [Jannaschia rubra]|uniref:PepSY domain-containing protein n=1 Tax=Jannaschia rubra TaxID=282197 RepID=UPI00249274DC|nr:PepSY domain-containing protein [Jannaschia rubra]